MSRAIPSFIVGMSAGAIFGSGYGLTVMLAAAVAVGIVNVACVVVSQRNRRNHDR